MENSASPATGVLDPVGIHVIGAVSVATADPGAEASVQPAGQCTVSPELGSVYEPAVKGLGGVCAHCSWTASKGPASPASPPVGAGNG
jgi:hypothetical protein